MEWLGLDIGGANLKAANPHGWARIIPFALWREPGALAGQLAALIDDAPRADRLAVTMTGELCDCFRTKADGVKQILAAVADAARGKTVRVNLVDGRFATIEQSRYLSYLAAASNWHALAQFAGRFATDSGGVLIDVGSTTTDIVPLCQQRPCSIGFNDTERLLAGELVYTGVGRTPVCAVVDELPWRGAACPVAAEFFATTADAYVVLGELLDEPNRTDTADGRPPIKEFAVERLARMVCADRTQFDEEDARLAAVAIREAQLSQLRKALHQVIKRLAKPVNTIVVSGAGEFLAQTLVGELLPATRIVSLSHELGPAMSACAPAYAVAVLAAEESRP